ncbi:MAG: caspase family protein [Saprospiraceae bacterium]|nr:caspase family protein [Saprospiraceae bacterium]
MLTALNQVFLTDENDVVMLYYSGHGLEGTFLPIDYDGIQNILKHDEVKDIINRSRAKNKICFIDACHSGSVLAQRDRSHHR